MPLEIISNTWTVSQGWNEVTADQFPTIEENSNIVTNHCEEHTVAAFSLDTLLCNNTPLSLTSGIGLGAPSLQTVFLVRLSLLLQWFIGFYFGSFWTLDSTNMVTWLWVPKTAINLGKELDCHLLELSVGLAFSKALLFVGEEWIPEHKWRIFF